MTTQSQNRAPEQDAVLSIGYVDYFNQATYQELLRAEAKIPDGVKLTAKTGAASPILYIEAVAPTEAVATSAAQAAADAFRNDVRVSLVAERTQEVSDLQTQVDAAVKQLQRPGVTPAEGNVILDQIRSLQGRITDIGSDATNHLKKLQAEPGVAVSSPSPVLQVALGGLGGLVLGILAALALAVLDNRIRTPSDVRRAGLDTLAEFGPGSDPVRRRLVVERLANTLSAVEGESAVVISVIGVASTNAAPRLAHDLAAASGARRAGSLLVRADLRRDPARRQPAAGLRRRGRRPRGGARGAADRRGRGHGGAGRAGRHPRSLPARRPRADG